MLSQNQCAKTPKAKLELVLVVMLEVINIHSGDLSGSTL